MSKICQITKKKPLYGNHRSHAMNGVKRRFLPNLQNHKFWDDNIKKFIKLRVSTKGIKLIDKKGINYFIKNKGY